MNVIGNYRNLIIICLVFGLAACVPEGVRIADNPASRYLERKSGTIVYSGLDGNIYLINQGGGAEKKLTIDANLSSETDSTTQFKNYYLPTWSPDGRLLAVASISGDESGIIQADLFTIDPDNLKMGRLFGAPGDEIPLVFSWSPDGELIAILTAKQNGLQQLYVVPGGGGKRDLIDVGSQLFWAWAPNGRQLMVHGLDSNGFARLSLISLEDPAIEERLEIRPSTFFAPEWTHDGRRILLGQRDDNGNDRLVFTDHQGKQPLLFNSITELQPAIFSLSPDDRHIAVLEDRDAAQIWQGTLKVHSIDSTETDVVAEIEDVVAYWWAPNGRDLAYFVLSLETQSTSNDQENGEAIPVVELFVLDSKRGESRQIADPFIPTQDFGQILFSFGRIQHALNIWSPDSNYLVISTLSPVRGPQIQVISASGNLEPRTIANGRLALWSWK